MVIATLVISILIFSILIYFRTNIWLWWIKRRRLLELIEKIPGPPSYPIVGCAYEFKWKIEDFSLQMFEFSKKFQEEGFPIARIWMGPFPVICAFSVQSVKAVLESNTVISKGTEYDIIKRWLGTGLLTSSGDKWKNRRKMITPAFHFNVLNSFLQIHDKEAQIFVGQIEKYANSGETFNLYGYIKRCALDIICETSMGTKINAQTNHNHPYVTAVQRMNELSFLYSRMPWLWFRPIWCVCGYENEYNHNLKLVTSFTRQVIANRRQQLQSSQPTKPSMLPSKDTPLLKNKSAFLDLLLGVEGEGNLTDEDIREEVDTFMFEGHDTTSSGMAWSLWCLAHHPDCQDKVIKEQDEIFGTYASNRSCTNEDLKKMRYLEQCIKESMRLFPPVPLMTRKVEQEEFDCVGYTIPKGSTILISPLITQRTLSLYEDADTFNPENFNQENCSKRNVYAYIPFSAGPRNCIGQKFALMEEKTVLSWFFRQFTIKPMLDFMGTLPCPEVILRPSKGIPVRIFRRRR